MKVAVIGGVTSTELLVRKLAAHGFDDVRVWGYVPTDSTNVSGWVDLARVAADCGFAYAPFRKVTECEAALIDFAPDILFVVGLSQIVPQSMIDAATRHAIGFHPTRLPKGRGRAAMAWLVLREEDGAANFFELRQGVDDGPIHVQTVYPVGPDDTASSVEAKMLDAEARALDEWLPRLKAGKAVPVEQDHDDASWFARRTPDDGRIDWQQGAEAIDRLVRASTRPHPGAFSHAGDERVVIWASSLVDRDEAGVPGRILRVEGDQFDMATGDGILRVSQWEATGGWSPRVGQRLGYDPEIEIADLRRRLAALEAKMSGDS
ncbi:methionyl-tRNA formyltransferase [Sphingomicrobium flavum]|uniref:methionyl-tRNA formyltransferase n=1 Tax=Sphingomicrobium flavum TaxID=1229164 RepID=UPI0021AD7F60|nr:formyltransferase family protein [Sphingomicrobium flavum]